MTIKVLPLEFWMEDAFFLEDCLEGGRYMPTPPRYKRPGIYLDGDACWFEVSATEAYSYPKEDFVYKLNVLNALRLNEHQAQSLKSVIAQKLASKEQRNLFHFYRDGLEIRKTGRMARKCRIAILGR